MIPYKKCNSNKTEAYWNKYEKFVQSQRQMLEIFGKEKSPNSTSYIK